MDSFYGGQDLCAQPEGRVQGEAALGLTASQLGQVLALQGHHYVVEAIVTTTADEATDVVFTCKILRNVRVVPYWQI